MRYESAKTKMGNVGVSYESQEAADLQAAQMDEKGNTNCSGCSGCFDCSGCYDCSGCSGCSDCSDCSRCSWCSGCSGCSDCSDFKQNPNRYTGVQIGSRSSQTTTYWVGEMVQVVCGCFRGNITEFENAVTKKHGDNEHGRKYRRYINIVRKIMEMGADNATDHTEISV